MDAFAFEDFRRADAFPRRGDFDQDAFAPDAVLFVKFDELVRLGDERLGVERKIRVGLGRDPARNNLQNFQSRTGPANRPRCGTADLLPPALDLLSAMALSTSHWYSGICAALKISDGLVVASRGAYCLSECKIAGVGDDHGELLQLVKLAQRG